MQITSVTAFKSRLSEFLKMVESGQVLLITDHGRPVAEVHQAPMAPQDSHRQHLYRSGVLRAPVTTLDLSKFDECALAGGATDLTSAVLEERDER